MAAQYLLERYSTRMGKHGRSLSKVMKTPSTNKISIALCLNVSCSKVKQNNTIQVQARHLIQDMEMVERCFVRLSVSF